MNTLEKSQAFTYTVLESGIHELTLHSASLEALDAFFVCLNQIFDGRSHCDPRLRFLVNATMSHLPPFSAIISRNRDLIEAHPDRPEVTYAFLVNSRSSYAVSALASFIRMFRRTNQVRSFRESQRDEALVWLLGETKPG
jgi:hypothetical protein